MRTTELGEQSATPVAADRPAAQALDDPICRWIVERGLAGDSVQSLLSGFCERAVAQGLPLLRCFIGVRMLNPLYQGYAFVWRRGHGELVRENHLREQGNQVEYLRSPFHYMFENGLSTLRQRLDRHAEPDFDIYESFRKEGATDYFVRINHHGQGNRPDTGTGMLFSATTDQPGGFTDEQLVLLSEQLQVLALATRSAATYETAVDVLGAYIGKDAGQRVMDGDIDRGNLHTIRAVILIADLRGFTRLSEEVSRVELGEILDKYLEAMVRPIKIYDGEVLKFLGDGLLAVFEIKDGEAHNSCRRGTGAAAEMLQGVVQLNKRRRELGLATMELDVAVHVGDVLYGNVGAPGRLDFTVIGPAVNETSRIEQKCDEVGVNVLFSDDFYDNATMCRPALRSVGRHALRDLYGERELYTLTADMLS